MTLREQFNKLQDSLCTQFGLTKDIIREGVVDLIYAEEMTMARLICDESTNLIAIAFHVETLKTDAFQILDFIKKSTEHAIGIAQDFYVDDNKNFYAGMEAYSQFYHELSANAQEEIAAKEYEPLVPVTYHSPYAIFEAHHPNAKEDRAAQKDKLRYFRKF
jgi:hypothetical protein